MGLLDLFKKVTGNTLYYASPLTRELQQKEFKDTLEVFKKLDIQVITLGKENTTGLEAYNAGYPKDAKEFAQKNFELFKKKRIIKIITSDPESYHMFKTIYPQWIKEWDIEVEHLSETILETIKKKKDLEYTKEEREKVTYHDPCYLSRHESITSEPREIITTLGGDIIEAHKSKESAICCGGEGNVRQNCPKEAKQMAQDRISDFPEDIKKIVVPEGMCLLQLSEQSDKVIGLSTFILQKLRGLGY